MELHPRPVDTWLPNTAADLTIHRELLEDALSLLGRSSHINDPTWCCWRRIDGGIELAWLKQGDAFQDFPAPVDPHGAAVMIRSWLDALEFGDWPDRPDIDGDLRQVGVRLVHSEHTDNVQVFPAWGIWHK